MSFLVQGLCATKRKFVRSLSNLAMRECMDEYFTERKQRALGKVLQWFCG